MGSVSCSADAGVAAVKVAEHYRTQRSYEEAVAAYQRALGKTT